MNNTVLFEDNLIIAINKESGLSAIPGRGEDLNNSLLSILEDQLKQKLFVVHRIDKDTSGVIMFAKDSLTHKLLNLQFEKRLVKKEYLALVSGMAENVTVIDSPIHEFGSGRMGIDKRGKASVTEITILDRYNTATLLKVNPLTGRRHQIRVHLYSVGFPILGDKVYGSPRPVGGVKRLMLHAHEIEFVHPDRSTRKITAPVTDDWVAVLDTFHRA